MKKLTDDILMFYADGTLDPAERARVEELLNNDPDARMRLEVFQATGRVLAELLRRHEETSVPKRLLDCVLPQETAPVTTSYERHENRFAPLKLWWGALRFPPLIQVGAGLAVAVALVAGTSAGWFTRGDRVQAAPQSVSIQIGDLLRIDNNRMFAIASLRGALETLQSGGGVKLSEAPPINAEIRMQMTFRNEAREYCREYEVEGASPMYFGGIACRDDSGEWSVLVHAMISPSHPPRAIVPAGGRSTAMDAVAVSLMDGDPLAVSDEANVIAKSWKK